MTPRRHLLCPFPSLPLKCADTPLSPLSALVKPDNAYLCYPPKSPPPEPWTPTAVLASRGTCKYEVKARNALKMSSLCDFCIDTLVVYDYVNEPYLYPMAVENTTGLEGIMGVSIQQKAGEDLLSILDDPVVHLIMFDGNIPDWDLEPQEWILAGVGGLVLLIGSMCAMLMCARSTWSQASQRQASDDNRLMTVSEVKKLTRTKYDVDTGCSDTSCAICIEEFEDGEALVRLPCNHLWHPQCIETWLVGSRGNCPTCKRWVRDEKLPQGSNRRVLLDILGGRRDDNGHETPLLSAGNTDTHGSVNDDNNNHGDDESRGEMQQADESTTSNFV